MVNPTDPAAYSWADAYATSVADVRAMQDRPARDRAADLADYANTRPTDPDDRDAALYAEEREHERGARVERYADRRDEA